MNRILSFIYSTSIYWVHTPCQALFSLVPCFPYSLTRWLGHQPELYMTQARMPSQEPALFSGSLFRIPSHPLPLPDRDSLNLLGKGPAALWGRVISFRSGMPTTTVMRRQWDDTYPGLKKSLCVFFNTLPAECQKAIGRRRKPKQWWQQETFKKSVLNRVSNIRS